MSSAITAVIVSSNICSVTDRDGTTILDVRGDRIYSLIGVGSLVWKRLASSPNGVSIDAILEELSNQFNEVPRDRIEHDVRRLLGSFQKKGLLHSNDRSSRLIAQAIRNTLSTGFFLLSRLVVGLLLKFRLNTLAAFVGFAAVNLTLKAFGFSGLCNEVRQWPVSSSRPRSQIELEVCEAVDRATAWYPKQALCLQRSAITTCLLRERGADARMVIGCRKIPFKAHAWAEVDHRAINEKKKIVETYKVLDRL